MNELTFIMR